MIILIADTRETTTEEEDGGLIVIAITHLPAMPLTTHPASTQREAVMATPHLKGVTVTRGREVGVAAGDVTGGTHPQVGMVG